MFGMKSLMIQSLALFTISWMIIHLLMKYWFSMKNSHDVSGLNNQLVPVPGQEDKTHTNQQTEIHDVGRIHLVESLSHDVSGLNNQLVPVTVQEDKTHSNQQTEIHDVGRIHLVESLTTVDAPSKDYGPQYVIQCTVGRAKKKVPFRVDTAMTVSSICYKDLLVLRLGRCVDTSERDFHQALGGVMCQAVGVLELPVKTPSGFTLITKMRVLNCKTRGGFIGLDVLAPNNCSILMSRSSPKLIVREPSMCCPMNLWWRALRVEAKANKLPINALLDTGGCRTILPESANIQGVPLPRNISFATSDTEFIEVSKEVKHLEIEVQGCVGIVDGLMMGELMIVATDFLAGKQIDFRCGKAFLSLCSDQK